MRASATHGIVLEDVFVAERRRAHRAGFLPPHDQHESGELRGQPAGRDRGRTWVRPAAVYDFALGTPARPRPSSTPGEPIGTAPFQQQLVGQMRMHLETATLWLRRQTGARDLRATAAAKDEVVAQWRIAKGTIAEEAFAVATNAMKACGTSNTANSGMVARSLRDLSMGLVQAFPAERGRLEAASHDRHRTRPRLSFGGRHVNPLDRDLFAMVGVWHDHLTAWDVHGRAVDHDPFGGVPGPFPYDNLVYCDFDGSVWTQTNVTFRGREPAVRTFEADVADGVLTFRRLGPEAPEHVGRVGRAGADLVRVAGPWPSRGSSATASPTSSAWSCPPTAPRPGGGAPRCCGATRSWCGRCWWRASGSATTPPVPTSGTPGAPMPRCTRPARSPSTTLDRARGGPMTASVAPTAAGTPALPPQRDLIAGAWADPALHRSDRVEDPNTGERRQRQARTDATGVERALAAAAALHASGDWSGRPAAERAEVLLAYADALEPQCPTIAGLEAATTGATITTTSMLSFIVHAAFPAWPRHNWPTACCRPGSRGRREGRRGRARRLGTRCPARAVERAGADGRPQGGLRPGRRVPGHHQAAGAGSRTAPRRWPGRPMSWDCRRAWCRWCTAGPGGRRAGAGPVVPGRVLHRRGRGRPGRGRGLRPGAQAASQLELGGHSPLVVLPDADVDAAADAAVRAADDPQRPVVPGAGPAARARRPRARDPRRRVGPPGRGGAGPFVLAGVRRWGRSCTARTWTCCGPGSTSSSPPAARPTP